MSKRRRAVSMAFVLVGTMAIGATKLVAQTATPVPGEHPAGQLSPLGTVKDGYLNAFFQPSELLALGNMGVGNFAGFSGVLVLLDGKLYKITEDGRAKLAVPADGIVYAEYANFAPTMKFEFDNVGMQELVAELNRRLANPNLIYSLRVDGTFQYMRYRSVKEQGIHPHVTVCAKNVDVSFEEKNIDGTAMGFLHPGYMKSSIGYSGPHLHFIDAERQKGGHVYDFHVAHASVSVAVHHRFVLDLPTQVDFAETNFDNPAKCPEQK